MSTMDYNRQYAVGNGAGHTAYGARVNADLLPDGLSIQIDGTYFLVQHCLLPNGSIEPQIARRLEVAHSIVIHRWEFAINLPEDVRRTFLNLVVLCQGRCTFCTYNPPGTFECPLAATLVHQVDRNSLSHVARVTAFAVEVAARFHSNAALAAAQQIKNWLVSWGATSERLNVLESRIRNASPQCEPGIVTPTEAAQRVLAAYQEERVARGESEIATPPMRYFSDDLFIWNSVAWQRIVPETFKARVCQILQNDGISAPLTESFIKSVIVNIKGITLCETNTSALPPFYVSSEKPLVVQEVQTLVFRNGVVSLDGVDRDLVRPTLYAHDARLFCTTALPYEYNSTAECPLWTRTLEEILPRRNADDRRVEVVQEYIGYSLFPRNHRHEAFLIMYGSGANGKSTVLNVIEELLGKVNVSHVPLEALQSEFRLEQMANKLANIAFDMQRLAKVEEGKLKTLASGEPIQINRKHRSPITMVPTAKLYFATNELPPFNDRSEGIWRRMITLPFLEHFGTERRDLNRFASLKQELPGILNWAMDGAIRLQRQGRFTECGVCAAGRAEHRHNSDPFLQFIDDYVTLEQNVSTPVTEVYHQYSEYCKANGRMAKSSSDFGKQLLVLPGVGKVRSGRQPRPYFYTGVRLVDCRMSLRTDERPRNRTGPTMASNATDTDSRE